MPTPTVTVEQCDWNIADAKEALECAVGLRDWDGVKKYADQLKEWEAKRYRVTSPAPFTPISKPSWLEQPR